MVIQSWDLGEGNEGKFDRISDILHIYDTRKISGYLLQVLSILGSNYAGILPIFAWKEYGGFPCCQLWPDHFQCSNFFHDLTTVFNNK